MKKPLLYIVLWVLCAGSASMYAQSPLVDSLLNYCRTYIGTPYHSGSIGPSYFDCSGYVMTMYSHFGYSLPHSSSAQRESVSKVDVARVMPGDLAFYEGRRHGGRVGHVGIVTEVHPDGSYRFIHASTHSGVVVSSGNEPYYHSRFVGFGRVVPCQWDSASSWYASRHAFNDSLVDVFYCLPTCVSEGCVYSCHLADSIFADSANLFLPFYRQAPMEAWIMPEDSLEQYLQPAMQDLWDAFSYYLRFHNHGRRFILAGFSQGGRGVLELLKRMDDTTYGRCVAAYACGYRISAEDLQHPHIVPATDADGGGVISYNTTTSPTAVLPTVSDKVAAAINPLTWSTDTMPVVLPLSTGEQVQVRLQDHLLLVDGLNEDAYFVPVLEKWFPKGCLHLYELTLYAPYLRENVKHRAYGK